MENPSPYAKQYSLLWFHLHVNRVTLEPAFLEIFILSLQTREVGHSMRLLFQLPLSRNCQIQFMYCLSRACELTRKMRGHADTVPYTTIDQC